MVVEVFWSLGAGHGYTFLSAPIAYLHYVIVLHLFSHSCAAVLVNGFACFHHND